VRSSDDGSGHRATAGVWKPSHKQTFCLARVQRSKRYPSELDIRGFDEPGADFVAGIPLDFMDAKRMGPRQIV
jgi:hypothetical protein